MWEAATPEQREWIDRECRDFRAWREAYTPGDSELDTFIATIWKLLELE